MSLILIIKWFNYRREFLYSISFILCFIILFIYIIIYFYPYWWILLCGLYIKCLFIQYTTLSLFKLLFINYFSYFEIYENIIVFNSLQILKMIVHRAYKYIKLNRHILDTFYNEGTKTIVLIFQTEGSVNWYVIFYNVYSKVRLLLFYYIELCIIHILIRIRVLKTTLNI